MSIDEKAVNIITNGSDQLTVVCGDLDNSCILSYESNKRVTFEPNTTTSVSLEEINLSLGFMEISTFLNGTQVVWNFIYPGIIR